MKRSKHSLSHYVLASFNMGKLVPVSNFEVLPGDSVKMSTSCLLRATPLVTPVMHPVNVRLHHWFVPYRLLPGTDGEFDFEAFITGGPDGMDSQTIPTFGPVTVEENSLCDYLGIPPGTNRTYSALPIQAYGFIYNEFYRDQDLDSVWDLETFDGKSTGQVRRCCWEKDYFTAARPWVQKGPDITLPLGTTAPVRTSSTQQASGVLPALDWRVAASGVAVGAAGTLGTDSSGGTLHDGGGTFSGSGVYPDNLEVDLTGATAVSVNDVRLAFALQRYEEARAQFGSRYTEYLRYLGVRSSDARLQRPEYLGGGRATISFSEVLRTGNNEDATAGEPVGQMRGHGISALRTRSWVRFFEEHGIVMTLASVRPRSMYGNGLHRHFFRSTKEDFWQKELELIGQQEILNKEVYIDDTGPDDVFGYQDRYAEYRHHPSYVTGEFRSTYDDWHLARIFGSDVALNATFVQCQPSGGIFAVDPGTADSMLGMFSHHISARRMVGNRTIGRLM